jgi:O-antigen/teichoic acid export membrane protein
MIGLPILTFLFLQADIFSLGKICNKELLGLYSMAMALATVSSIMFNQVAGPMILPVLADAQDNVSVIRDRLLRMTRLLFLFGLPMVVCQVVYAKPILTIVYGLKYAQVATAFSFLSVYAILSMATVLVASTYMALGRPEVHRSFTIIRLISLCVILYPMIRGFGASGAAFARVSCMLLAGIIQQYSLSRLIVLPIRQYLKTALQGAILAAIVLIPALTLKTWIVQPGFQILAAMGLCGASWGYVLWTKRGLIRPLVSDTNLTVEPGE